MSSVGYCCIHLFGVAIGRLLYAYALDYSNCSLSAESSQSTHHTKLADAEAGVERNEVKTTPGSKVAVRVRLQFLAHLLVLSLLAFAAYGIHEMLGPVHEASRRVGNAAFVYWIVQTHCFNNRKFQMFFIKFSIFYPRVN